MRDPALSWTTTLLGILLIIYTVCASASDPTNAIARKKDKSKSCKDGDSQHPEQCATKPTTQPASAPTSSLPSTDDEITFENESIYLANVIVLPMEDIDALFQIQKNWLETYVREQDRRWFRGRRLQNRRRDSRDIITQFEFVRQDTTTGADGKPTNKVTYNQNIGFLPSRRRKRRVNRNLEEINLDNPVQVYEVSTRAYRDLEALNELARTLQENVDSLTSMEGIYKLFDPVRVQPPLVGCGSLCEGGSQMPLNNTTRSDNSTNTNPN